MPIQKAEIIKKDVILITLDRPIYECSIDETLNIEVFSECRFFKGTHSIKKAHWTYYCKSESYYCTDSYCLIIDLSKKEEALKDFFKTIRASLQDSICSHRKEIVELEEQILASEKLYIRTKAKI